MKKLNQAVDRFCILHPNFGIPNLMLYIVIANVAVYLLDSFSRGALSMALYFSPSLVLHGQIWRLVTFAAVPAGSGLMFLLYCYFTYSMGRTLEQQWGTAKFTCYYLGGMLLTVLGVTATSLILHVDYPVASTSDITFAMFLAFAVLFPDATFVLFPLPIPIRAKYIAYFDLALFAYEILSPILRGYWYAAVVPLMALLNVFIMIWPEMADFLHLAIEAGRSIPEELKLVSYDGTIITRITNPPLTSIVQDIPMLAQTCASTVIDLVEQRRMVPHKQLISVSVRQGGTTYPV